MFRLFKTPKIQIALALLFIFITALIRHPSLEIFLRFLFTLVLAIAADLILLKLRKIEFFLPSASIVSALIISLLAAPNLSLIELALTVLIAVISKHFLSFNKRHIFNPAAFGLLCASLLFGHIVSWWGVSWQQFKVSSLESIVFFLILLVPGYVSAIKMRRLKIIAAFLLVYNLFNYFFYKSVTVLDPTVLFFSLVMLPEPITTPNKKNLQIYFGIFVGLVSITLSYSLPIFNFQLADVIPDPLIAGLLIANLIFFKWR